MRFFVSPSCGHFSKTDFVMGDRVGSETEFSIMQKFGKNLVEALNERKVRAMLLDVSNKPGVSHKPRFDQGPNAFVLMCGLEKSPKRLALSSVLTVRHSKVSQKLLDALVGPLNAWLKACASEKPPCVVFEEFRFDSQSSVMQILPFRYSEVHELLYAQRLDALAETIAKLMETFVLELESKPQKKSVVEQANV